MVLFTFKSKLHFVLASGDVLYFLDFNQLN